MAKLNIRCHPMTLVQAQQIALEHLANAIRDSDQVALDDRNSDKVFDICRNTLQSRSRKLKDAEVGRVLCELWHYLRYQMTDDTDQDSNES